MKLTKDGNIHELYSTEDYYKETVDYTRYLFNLFKNTYGEQYYSSSHDRSNNLHKKFRNKNFYIEARYNYSSGSLESVRFPDGREMYFDSNGVLKSEIILKKNIIQIKNLRV